MRTADGQTVAWIVVLCGIAGVLAALLSGPLCL
jgi:hypothetical protein